MMNPVGPLACCLELCVTIADQLNIAQHNKKECGSLVGVIESIKGFLKKLPSDGLSAEGNNILQKINITLGKSQQFLVKVANTGPLTSLLLAKHFREDVLRFNRELSSLFNVMSAGESLVYLYEQRMQALNTVQAELKTSKTLFIAQETIAEGLIDTAATAQQQSMPAEQLNTLLLRQLNGVEEVAGLSPEELLDELYILQVEALYGEDRVGGKPKVLGNSTEEFLVKQICSAYAPKAAQASRPLNPLAAAQPPAQYLCPISHEVMTRPVMLVETGQTFEYKEIAHWLEAHDTCPVTGRRVASKQLMPNYILQSVIEQWVQEHGLRSPSDDLPKDELVIVPGESFAEPSPIHSSTTPRGGMHGLLPLHTEYTVHDGPKDTGAAERGTRLRCAPWLPKCTRTAWAVTLIVLVIGITVGLGVGIYCGLKRESGGSKNPVMPTPVTPLQSLLAVKAAIDPGNILKGWNAAEGNESGFCKWSEIVCDDHNNVTDINVTSSTVQGLTGTLPPAAAFAGLPALTTIAIQDQQGLRGTLPPDWSQMDQMEYVFLSNNSLAGPLPAEWSNVTKLVGLDLSSNSLTGPLPGAWANLKQLALLSLHHNLLTGHLPDYFQNFNFLEGLALAYNAFSGTIPDSWGSLTKLSVLHIGLNKLSGPLPDNFNALILLEELTMFQNQFSGTLPDSWGTLQALQLFDLSFNSLSGPIPASWGSMMQLGNASFDNNIGLTGCFPSQWDANTGLDLTFANTHLNATFC